ncbi:Hypothetical_protein [Hexamita inflata]|uniref:Hypothetical_protein n=1 Tax=Hexamita inflata TaxID=28002 RepID=A0AA86QGG3_9EUKA|nr:Hypothetical protein HINF_LOCUS40359 [Hexamita inflata]
MRVNFFNYSRYKRYQIQCILIFWTGVEWQYKNIIELIPLICWEDSFFQSKFNYIFTFRYKVATLDFPLYKITQLTKEIFGEDNNKYSCWCDMQLTVTIPDFKNYYFSYNQKMLKHCLKVVRCYINTKQRCHLYLSASSCFPLLKRFQLTCQICYNKEITLKRYEPQNSCVTGSRMIESKIIAQIQDKE